MLTKPVVPLMVVKDVFAIFTKLVTAASANRKYLKTVGLTTSSERFIVQYQPQEFNCIFAPSSQVTPELDPI